MAPPKAPKFASVEQLREMVHGKKTVKMEHPDSILGDPTAAGKTISAAGLTKWIKYHKDELDKDKIEALRAVQRGEPNTYIPPYPILPKVEAPVNAPPPPELIPELAAHWTNPALYPKVGKSAAVKGKLPSNPVELLAKIEGLKPVDKTVGKRKKPASAAELADAIGKEELQSKLKLLKKTKTKVTGNLMVLDKKPTLEEMEQELETSFKLFTKQAEAAKLMFPSMGGNGVNQPLAQSTSATVSSPAADVGGTSSIDIPAHPVGADAPTTQFEQQHNLVPETPVVEATAPVVTEPELPGQSELMPVDDEIGAPITSALVNTSATMPESPVADPAEEERIKKNEMLKQYAEHTSHELIYLLTRNKIDPSIIKEVRQLLKDTLATEQNGGKQLEDLNNPQELNPLVDPRVGLQSFAQAQSVPTTRAAMIKQENIFATGFRQRNDVPLTSTTADPTIMDERNLGPLIRNILAAERYTQSYGPSTDRLWASERREENAEAAQARQFQTNAKQFIRDEWIDKSVYSESQRNTLEEIKTNPYTENELLNIYNTQLHPINSRTTVDNLNSGPQAVKLDDDFSFCRSMFRRS
jgi:hypothetical protein